MPHPRYAIMHITKYRWVIGELTDRQSVTPVYRRITRGMVSIGQAERVLSDIIEHTSSGKPLTKESIRYLDESFVAEVLIKTWPRQ